ncbi:MAG: radical SAM protein [Deltaproteobacteria bacterium]|nr:MAG: radical SAM protein [Deltaproteobacteria bacterium]
MKFEYRPYRARSMINKLKHVDDWFWISYTLNPYRGCAHLCIYCDARDNQYGLSATFEQIVYCKENAVEVLKRQLLKLERGIVGTGGVCDAYQPIEAERRITRRILETLAQHRFPVEVLTKSDLVLRDLDVLQEINSLSWAGVLFTITTFDPVVTKRFEPYAPPPERRLAALERVAEAGLTTGVMLCPYLPGISDDEAHLEEVVRWAKDAGAQFVLCGGLTLKEGPQKTRFLETLERHYPHLIPRYRQLYKAGFSPQREYSCQVGQLAREICRRYGMPDRMPRPILPGEKFVINKRIAEKLFLRAYEMDLEEGAGYRIWAYRKAAWTVDEWPESIAKLYADRGEAGLRELPGIGRSLAREISGWLKENAGGSAGSKSCRR